MKKGKIIKNLWISFLIFLPLFYAIYSIPSNNIPFWNDIKDNNDIPTEKISISSNPPPNGMIYAKNSTIINNTYAIRIDGGYHIIENTLNISKNHLNGIPVLNSNVIEKSDILDYNYLNVINLYSKAKLVMRNIYEPQLNIYLFDKSELIIEECVINSIITLDSSKVLVRNSTINGISDTLGIFSYPFYYFPFRKAASRIEIFNNSYIENVFPIMGSTCIVDNSSILDMVVGGISFGLGPYFRISNITEPLNQVTITNSTIYDFTLAGISIAYIFGSNINHINVVDLSFLTLNASVVSTLYYGIVCNVGNTNIIDGGPSGMNYFGNTLLIGTSPTTSELLSIAVNNSASVYIEGWPGFEFELYLHDSATAEINNTNFFDAETYMKDNSKLTIRDSQIYSAFADENSQLTIIDSTIEDLVGLSNSSLIIQENSNIGPFSGCMFVGTTGFVSINDSTILDLQIAISNSGSPAGNVTIKNSTLTTAMIYGSSVVTIDNCSINWLSEGIVVYTGSIIMNSTGISGSGSYTNYTKILSSTIFSRYPGVIEVNNTANIIVKNIPFNPNIILMNNANATIINSSILMFNMNNNTNAFIYNSTVSNMFCRGNSNCEINLNSSIDTIICTESSTGNIVNTTITYLTEIYESAKLTVQKSFILGAASVKSSNLTEFSLRIYNSAVLVLTGINWNPFPIPLSNHPRDFTTPIYESKTIDWVLYDSVGNGKYRVWTNDSNNNYYIWVNWTNWLNNTNLEITVNRSAIGVFNYTIEFNNSKGQFGIPDTVIVTVRNPYLPHKSIIYAEESTINNNNNYSIRIDSGNTIIENTLNLTEGKINGTEVINSTRLEDSDVLGNSSVAYISLYNNATLNMSHIWDRRLNFYLFDNSQLYLENCTINDIYVLDSSKVWIKNSTTGYTIDSDMHELIYTQKIPSLVSSSINILPDSYIYGLYGLLGANYIVENSTIYSLFVGGYNLIAAGTSSPRPTISEPSMQATVTNSTIYGVTVAGISKITIYNSIIDYISTYDMGSLTLNSCSILSKLEYGIICSSGTTNIINGIPSGNYYNNTKLINTPLPPTTSISCLTVNNSADVYIDNHPADEGIRIILYDSALVYINNSNTVFISSISFTTFDNSKVIIENSDIYEIVTEDNSSVTITDSTIGEPFSFYYLFQARSNSSITIENNSIINSLMLSTTGSVSIDNSTIDRLSIMDLLSSGSPAGKVSIKNSTIQNANVSGSSAVIFETCQITSLIYGIVIYAGTVNLDLTGISGSGSYTNYTKIISSPIIISYLGYIEVNNSATININDIPSNFHIYLFHGATATLNNASIVGLSLEHNSNAIIHNSILNDFYSKANSSFTIDQFSTVISSVNCLDSSSGTISSSILGTDVIVFDSAMLTIRKSTILGTARVSGSTSKGYSLNMYNSSVDTILGVIIGDEIPISNHPDDIITDASGSETIDWILCDNLGGSHYRVWVNDTNDNYYEYIGWTPWTNDVPLFILINYTAPGIYNYTVEYNDSSDQYGIPDMVKVTILNALPTSTHPNNITTSAGGLETINWTLYDDFGPGQYRIWVNDTNDNYYELVGWTPWFNASQFSVSINRSDPGIYNYTIEYYDEYNLFGIPDTIIITITDASPTSNHPENITTTSGGLETINWTLYDDFGPGQYQVWANDTNDNYYVILGWSSWTNDSTFNVAINRSVTGIFNYTIEYYDNYNNYGIPDSVFVTIEDITPPNIVTIFQNPSSPNLFNPVNITVRITDDFNISRVFIEHNLTNPFFKNYTMNFSSGNIGKDGWWNYTISPGLAGSTISYRILCNDSVNLWDSTIYYTYKIKGSNGIKQRLNPGMNKIFLYGDEGFMWLNLTIYVKSTTYITLTYNTSQPASFPSKDNGIVFYNLTLDDPTALENVTARFHYKESGLNGYSESDITLYYYNSSSGLWEQIIGITNESLNFIEVTLYNLSIFVLGPKIAEEEFPFLFPPPSGDNFIIIIIIIGAIAGVAVVAIVVAKTRKGEKVEKEEPKFPKAVIEEEKIPTKVEEKIIPVRVKKEDLPKKEKIIVKRAYDYVGGNIRFKVVVENKSDEILRDISVLLNTREQFEIKSAVEKILLLDINESRGLDFILTPMTCGKSTIYGTISYLDVKGQQFSTFMEPSVVQIKCPLVIPKIASSSDLRQLKEKLQYSHAEIEYTGLNISKAYQIAKDQISSLDVSEIEEHSDIYNVLYSGEAKVTGDQIIIDLNLKPDTIIIDVYLRDMKQSTGFLAYIKNLINLALQYSKDIFTTLDKITTKIYNAFEFGQRLSELFNLCQSKEPLVDIILLLKELKNKSYSYFPDLRITESFEKWSVDLEKIRDKDEEIWERTYLNLQFFILAWLEAIIVFSETNTKNYFESPAVVEETLKNIEWGNAKLKEDLINKTKQYSRNILFALMVIHKITGLSIYNHNFKGETLDSDLISGFLTAIRSFGAELSKKETAMKKLSYEHFEIQIEEGEFVNPALITLGFPDELTIKLLNDFLIRFETRYRNELEDFSGNVSLFLDTKDIIQDIFLKK